MDTTKSIGTEQLRADAEARLRTGTAPATAGWGVGTEALSLLYRLASDPERSGDALKLLHESKFDPVSLGLSAGIAVVSLVSAYLAYARRDLYI